VPETPEPINRPFSEDLHLWSLSKKPKTIETLTEVFGEKSFAVVFVVLMALPAMPLPTGGISHFFEIIVALLALEMVVGRRSIWLPSSWKKRPLNKTIVKKGIPYLVKKIAVVERYSKPRLTNVTTSRLTLPLLGLVIIAFTVAAFIAPPFSGLDTLPALGVVLISLGLILEDALGLVLGTIVGCLGVFLLVGLGSAVINAIF
jgi:hypothetical protein